MTSPLSDVPLAMIGESPPGLSLVQRFLVRFGYLEPGVFLPGTLDAETAAALRKYQARHRLEVSGNFDAPTRDLVATPRCALPDLHRGLARAALCIWPNWSLTYRFAARTPDVGLEIDAVRRAVRTWAATVPVAFTEVAAGGADVVVGWQPADCNDYDMQGDPVLAAHADYPLGCREIPPLSSLPLPVHFNDDLKWCIGTVAGEFDVETAALHELGHILGLRHAGAPGDVMFSTLSPQFENHSPKPAEVTAVQSLYPAEAGWRACAACAALFQGTAATTVCPAAGTHDPGGSANHHLAQGFGTHPGWHPDWRRCVRCAGLFFGGNPTSVCPDGGVAHDGTGSADYSLLAGAPAIAGQQRDWRQCQDCQGLFFAGAAGSVCPAGGTHDRTGSADYSLVVR